MLADSLSCHSELRVLGEVLNPGPDDYWPAFRRPLVARLYSDLEDISPDSNCVPLLTHLFESYDGLVLHRESQLSKDNPTWEYLASKADLRIIHLYRRNLFRQYLSERIAVTTQIWHRSTSDAATLELPPIRIDPDRCLQIMRRRRAMFDWGQQLFRKLPNVTINYEDIEHDIGGVLAYCQGFLGVPLQTLPVRYRKLSNKPLSQLISNLAEIEACLANTEFTPLLTCLRE